MAIYLVLFKYFDLSGNRRRIMDVNLLAVRQPSGRFLATQIFQHLPGALRICFGMN
jgi:hypothetical protein